jgi:hypothetical protein
MQTQRTKKELHVMTVAIRRKALSCVALNVVSFFAKDASNRILHDMLVLGGQVFGSCGPCPKCAKNIDFGYGCPNNPAIMCQKVEQLINEKQQRDDDPRLAQWLVLLGNFYKSSESSQDGERNALLNYKRAGRLGLGEGYLRVAEFYIHKQNWNDAICGITKRLLICIAWLLFT